MFIIFNIYFNKNNNNNNMRRIIIKRYKLPIKVQ